MVELGIKIRKKSGFDLKINAPAIHTNEKVTSRNSYHIATASASHIS